MRVFVTGANGSIGSVVVPELIAAGHEVLGLARSDAAAAVISAAGGTPLRGDLTDLDSLRAGVARTEGVINLAFGNDWSNLGPFIDAETQALQTLAAALAGSGKPFVHAGLTPMMPGHISTEQDPDTTDGPVGGRGLNSQMVLTLADQGVRSSVVRLPRSVGSQPARRRQAVPRRARGRCARHCAARGGRRGRHHAIPGRGGRRRARGPGRVGIP